MVSLTALWLPILVSGVLVFVASSLIHMVLGWHASDFKKFASEDAVMDALRPFNLAPGDYVAPRPDSMAQMNTPEFKAKMARGPQFSLTILVPQNSMGRISRCGSCTRSSSPCSPRTWRVSRSARVRRT